MRFIRPKCRKGKHPQGGTAYLYYRILSSCSDATVTEKCSDFFARVMDNVNIQPASVEYALSKWIDGANSTSGGGSSFPAYVAIWYKAWNAFMRGDLVKTLSFKENEDFPKLEAF